jgi:hypothetical protein
MTSSPKGKLSRHTRKALLIGVFCVAALFTLQRAWNTNAAALQTRAHLSRNMDCAANLGLMWEPDGTVAPQGQTPYLQALSASAGARGASLPADEGWSRDLRLLYWFRAHALIREGKYVESLPYLKQAQAGAPMSATGHFMWNRGEKSCAFFVWLLAIEVAGDTGYVDVDKEGMTAWAISLLTPQDAPIILEAYSSLLKYEPGRPDWQLMVERAQQAIAQQKP